MLNNDALSQLKQLKQQIEDNKEYAEGTVKGTQRKFGFLVTDDKREIYLPPEEMQKVFPGDRIKIQVFTDPPKKGDKGKQAAKVRGEILKLLDSPVGDFAGRYVVRGKGHFVETDLPNISRWLFVPPNARNNAKDGDYVYCRMTRHPFRDGKPQAQVLALIGPQKQAGIEADYILAKFQLAPAWPEQWREQLASPEARERSDLTAIPFVTIDAASTQDMDDALFAEQSEQGWRLQIAIADPESVIAPGSELDRLARQRATSVYLPGRAVAMLPEGLANELCSLLPEQERPALVCSLDINPQGEITGSRFEEATIRSRAKLSYQQVAAFIDNGSDEACQPYAEALTTLQQVANALLENRRRENLVIPNRQDFRLVLNENRKLERIEPLSKTSAHQLVEECMIAANRSAAEFMGDRGLFVEHPGFRAERLPDVKKLAEEQLALTGIDFNTPQGYLQLMKAIDDEALEFPLRAVLSRLLERSRFTTEAKPHQGMGMARYTTITSPIRKYSDLIGHRIIKAKLRGQPQPDCTEQQLAELQAQLDRARQAGYQMEQWLKCQYMEPLVGQRFSGEITQINSNGFTVRLNEHLIEGFVETRLLKEKYSFDPMRLRLKSKEQSFELGQSVEVTVTEVDVKQRRIRYGLDEAAAAATDEQQPEQTTEAENA